MFLLDVSLPGEPAPGRLVGKPPGKPAVAGAEAGSTLGAAVGAAVGAVGDIFTRAQLTPIQQAIKNLAGKKLSPDAQDQLVQETSRRFPDVG